MPVTTTISGVQYSGVWTMQQVNAAIAAGTWPVPPSPKLYVWGQNNNGQLGLGNTTNYSSPKQVGSLTTWSKISIATASASIKTDGTLWMWGYNGLGGLGLGNTTYYSSPKQVGSLTDWLNVSSGGYQTAAIKTNGTIWTWGYNANGQLGLGNTTQYSSPKQVGALTTWATIFISQGTQGFCAAIKTDGTLWMWGYNGSGTLGLGNVTSRSSPVQVGSLTNWAKVAISSLGTTLAIKTDGTFWAWGGYNAGTLPLNVIATYSSPKQVGALTSWLSITAGQYFAAATKTDGTLWIWGRNADGQLGLGNTTNYSSPKQVGSLTDWSSIAASRAAMASIKTNGTLWTWGVNSSGQLGFGNTTSYSSPKQVGSLGSWTTVAAGQNNVLTILIT